MEQKNNMKLIVYLIIICAYCSVNAQNVSKKCKTCGKVLSSCSFRGQHPVPTSGNIELTSRKPTAWQTKDGGKTWKKVVAENIVIRTEKEIDLGLPSGTIWAGWNIDATKPEEIGGYYSYGEVSTKKYYSNNDYIGKSSFVQGDPKADVATCKWGTTWCMPIEKQATELRNKCTWTYFVYNGVAGVAVTGPNGKSLFLPIGEYIYKGKKGGNNCGYITAIGSDGACQLGFANGYLFIGYDQMVVGYNVRAVKKK